MILSLFHGGAWKERGMSSGVELLAFRPDGSWWSGCAMMIAYRVHFGLLRQERA